MVIFRFHRVNLLLLYQDVNDTFMRKMRYTLDYMNQQLRETSIYGLDEVLVALIEPNGTLYIQRLYHPTN
jgi:uncharacterized membrane protein YcaP (DUF421 family)